MRKMVILVILCLLLPPPTQTSQAHQGSVILEQFLKDGKDRVVGMRFIRRSHVKSQPDQPMTDRRTRELILAAERSVEQVNERIRATPWHRRETIAVKEVLQNIATENRFQNVVAQAPWESQPNYGYMALRIGTAFNALLDLEIDKVGNTPVPRNEKDFWRNKKFRETLALYLIQDPEMNLLLGSWTYLKYKNLARGDFTTTVAYYTMGKDGYERRQKLTKVAKIHIERWRGWRTVYLKLQEEHAKELNQLYAAFPETGIRPVAPDLGTGPRSERSAQSTKENTMPKTVSFKVQEHGLDAIEHQVQVPDGATAVNLGDALADFSRYHGGKRYDGMTISVGGVESTKTTPVPNGSFIYIAEPVDAGA